jgi:hypothetical protein
MTEDRRGQSICENIHHQEKGRNIEERRVNGLPDFRSVTEVEKEEDTKARAKKPINL